MPFRTFVLAVLLALLAIPVEAQPNGAWQPYREPADGYRIELPIGSFEIQQNSPSPVLTLHEIGGNALLEVYSGKNPDGLTSTEFADFLSQAERIDEVTYRRVGRTWFVISGFYERDAAEPEDMIFYAKFMFSADRSRFAAFEISYPLSARERFDVVVERLEASFRGPT